MYYTFSSTSRFSTFEKKVCTFLFRFSFVVFEKKVCTFLSTFQNLEVKKNPMKKYFIKHRLNAVNTLFETVKTEKLRFFSFYTVFFIFFPKTQRLKLLAQNLAVIKYNKTI